MAEEQAEEQAEGQEQTDTDANQVDATAEAAYDEQLKAAGFEVDTDARQAADDVDEGDGARGGDDSGAEDGGQDSADAQDATGDEGAEPTFTPKELRAAEKAGFSEDDLLDLGDKAPALLEKFVARDSEIGRRWAQIGKAEREARTRDDGTGKESDEEERKPLLDPAEYEGDDYVPHLNSMDERVHKLEQAQAKRSQDKEDEDALRGVKEADVWLNGLGLKDVDEFGEGSTLKLDKDSPEYAARVALYDKADQIQLGFETATGDEMSNEKALGEAFAILYPDAQIQAKKREKQAALDKRKKQVTAPPTGRKTTDQYANADERAKELLGEKEKELGIRFFTGE